MDQELREMVAIAVAMFCGLVFIITLIAFAAHVPVVGVPVLLSLAAVGLRWAVRVLKG